MQNSLIEHFKKNLSSTVQENLLLVCAKDGKIPLVTRSATEIAKPTPKAGFSRATINTSAKQKG